MEAGVNLLGRAECRYTKEHVCKISGQYIHFNRSYDSFCNVRTFVLIYRPHPVIPYGAGKIFFSGPRSLLEFSALDPFSGK